MSRIARASLTIAFFFGLDKILGFLRQVLFTRVFSSNELDIFLTSNNIPDLLSALISGGALGIALIPVLSEHLQREGRQAAWELFSRILNLAFLVTAAVAVVIILLADPVVQNITAPGFEAQKQALTASLMRLDLVAILIFSISGLVMAGLQANQHFLLPAMAPAFYNLGQIFGVTILAPETGLQIGPITLPAFGMGLYGLVYGVILGALLHLLIQIPGLVRYGFRWAPVLGLRDAGVRQVLRLMGPRVVTMLFLQFYFLARDNLASRLQPGSVTVLNYGWFIMQLPETLIGTAIAIAMLPTLSELITNGEEDRFRETVNHALRAMLALALPAAVFIAVSLPVLIPYAFAFNESETNLLIWTTRAYLLGLLGHVWLEVAVRSFYAQQDARTPMLIAGLQTVIYLILAVSFLQALEVVGLALADTLSFTAQALALLFLLNRRFRGVLRVEKTLLRAVIGTAIGGLILYLLIISLPLHALIATLCGLILGGVVVLPFIWSEMKILIRL